MQQQAHGGFLDVNAVGDEFSSDLGSRKNSTYDATVAVRKRPHGVVHVHGVMHSSCDGRTRLFVGRIRVAHRDHQSRFTCRFDAWRRAQ